MVRPLIYMFLRNPLTHDARVLREAGTLASNGYEVVVVATMRTGLPPREERDGFTIVRLPIDPIHYRILRRARRTSAAVRRAASAVLARTRRVLRGAARPVRRLGALGGRRSLRARARRAWYLLSRPVRVGVLRPLRALVRLVLPDWRRDTAPAAAQASRLPYPLRRALDVLRRRGPLMLLMKILRTAAGGIGLLLLNALHYLLFLGHRPFLLLDYTTRSTGFVGSRPAAVYHAHDLNTLLAAYLAARRGRGRLIYDSHELNLEAAAAARIRGPLKWLLRRYEAFLIRRVDAVITVNGSIADVLAGQYHVPRPLVLMNCPARRTDDHVDTVLRDRLGLNGLPLAVYHGNLSPHRGLEQLVRAMALLADVHLIFLGAGSLRRALEAQVVAEGLSERVHFVDPVPPDALLRHLSSADIGVVPIQAATRNHYLASPNKLFECLMAGVPVAASDLPEMARVVRDTGVGALFEPEDPADIARAIRTVLQAPDPSETRRRARALAMERYSWEVESAGLISLYARLAPAGPAPTRAPFVGPPGAAQ